MASHDDPMTPSVDAPAAATGEPRVSSVTGEPRVSSVTGALRRSWWVIALLVAVGAAAAAVFTFAAADKYSASASVYVGQTTDANGNPMTGLSTNVRAATQLLDSDAVLQKVAEQVGGGMTASRLRRETTVDTPSQTVRTTQSVVSFVVIMVTDADPQLAADAANALADELMARIMPTNEQRIALLEQHEADLQEQLDASRARARQAQESLDTLRGDGDAAAAAPYLAVVQAAATEQQTLLTALQKAQLMLQVAATTEQPRLLHEAAVPDATRQNAMALNVAAGALAGLVVGIVVAFVRARPRSGRAA